MEKSHFVIYIKFPKKWVYWFMNYGSREIVNFYLLANSPEAEYGFALRQTIGNSLKSAYEQYNKIRDRH